MRRPCRQQIMIMCFVIIIICKHMLCVELVISIQHAENWRWSYWELNSICSCRYMNFNFEASLPLSVTASKFSVLLYLSNLILLMSPISQLCLNSGQIYMALIKKCLTFLFDKTLNCIMIFFFIWFFFKKNVPFFNYIFILI